MLDRKSISGNVPQKKASVANESDGKENKSALPFKKGELPSEWWYRWYRENYNCPIVSSQLTEDLIGFMQKNDSVTVLYALNKFAEADKWLLLNADTYSFPSSDEKQEFPVASMEFRRKKYQDYLIKTTTGKDREEIEAELKYRNYKNFEDTNYFINRWNRLKADPFFWQKDTSILDTAFSKYKKSEFSNGKELHEALQTWWFGNISDHQAEYALKFGRIRDHLSNLNKMDMDSCGKKSDSYIKSLEAPKYFIGLFTKADRWLLLKDQEFSAHYDQVTTLRNNVYHALIEGCSGDKSALEARLANANAKNLKDTNYFANYWNKVIKPVSIFKTEATRTLDKAFAIYKKAEFSEIADKTLLDALDTWLMEKGSSRSKRLEGVLKIKTHLEKVRKKGGCSENMVDGHTSSDEEALIIR